MADTPPPTPDFNGGPNRAPNVNDTTHPTDIGPNNPTDNERRLSKTAKTLVDVGPLAVFFIVYFFGRRLAPVIGSAFGQNWSIADGGELFAALIAYMPVFGVAFLYSLWRERRVGPMLVVSFVVVVLLGSLTLIFKDRTFFYMKPTIAYTLFATTLAGGLFSGRNFLKLAFDGALSLPDAAWLTLTKRYAVFFAVLAVAHEIIWRWLMWGCDINAGPRCPGEPVWVNVKLFGFTAINIVFAAAQAPFLAKHLEAETANTENVGSD
ncbi:MAG: inner membrane-spanning protein YciB [Pseudomonadota bacterium]